MTTDIHIGQPVISLGADSTNANLIVILLHGRTSRAQAMLPVVESLQMEGVRFLLPQAGLNR